MRRATAMAFTCVFGFMAGSASVMSLFASPTTDQGLPPLPTSVVSQIGPTPIVLVPGLKCDGVPAMGCFQPENHVIQLRAGMPLNVSWQTLEHEKFHMVVSDAGIPVPNPMDDAIADALGSHRVLEMRASLHIDP